MLKRVFGMLLLVVLVACGSSAPAAPVATDDGGAASGKTVRVGYVPVLIYAPLYVGIERGYFAAEGITIESTPIQGGSSWRQILHCRPHAQRKATSE
ncbi:MAG: hypothetical protein LW717_06505 [Chloroflexaceae bacterium]|nr:hypothetical protein [Chloroflexaceae bacterium]